MKRRPVLPVLLPIAAILALSWGLPVLTLAARPGKGNTAAGKGSQGRESRRPPEPGIYAYDELTSLEAARINREMTIILQPVGLVHPHGPHLPAGTDNRIVEALARKTAEKIRAYKPEYSVLLMPLLPIGTGPSNELGYIYTHPGSAGLSRPVLEMSLVDWSLNFATNSWSNFFVISFHNDPSEYKVLTDVTEFLHEAYGMAAANVTSLVLADSLFLEQAGRLKGAPPDSTPLVLDLHGGAAETSLLLSVAPDLVRPDYMSLPPLPVRTWEDRAKTAQRMGWMYYFGNPAKASAAYGRELLDLLADAHSRVIVATVLDRFYPHNHPHFEDVLKREFSLREIVRSSEANELRTHQKYAAWLKQRQDKP